MAKNTPGKTTKTSTSGSKKQKGTGSGKVKSVSTKVKTKKSSSNKGYDSVEKSKRSRLESGIDMSTRLFGMPHQFLESADPRLGNGTKLGRVFSEYIALEAPKVYIKPGISEFLPGMSDKKKKDYIAAIQNWAKDGDNVASQIIDSIVTDTEDPIQYFNHKTAYNGMMVKVNMLARIMSVFLGIDKKPVPWVKGGKTTYGHYDWRYYQFKSIYQDATMSDNEGETGSSNSSIAAFIKNAVKTAEAAIMDDTEYIQFYVEPNSSVSDSASNSTTSSVLSSYTSQLEGVAKELSTVSAITGSDVRALASESAASVDNFINDHATGNGAIATLLKRISGNTKQIIAGGNFIIPEMWSDSDFSKGSMSFSTVLSTPYGGIEPWYINVGVPLCFFLGLALPIQLTANTFKSPYLIKAFSPGFGAINLGIITDLSVEKGGDQTWNINNLPNEIKVSFTIKDLYSSMALPKGTKPGAIMSNTGMLEYLMTTCGLDLSKQGMSTRYEIWANLFTNQFTEKVHTAAYELRNYGKNKVKKFFQVF